MGFLRRTKDRPKEAERAKKTFSYDVKDKIGAKLGINRDGRNMDKIRYEVNRNKKNLKILGINKDELKQIGIEI